MNNELTQIMKQGVQLYYKILKMHKQKLPKQLRLLGDLYVKQ
jgi:hypothetical protein